MVTSSFPRCGLIAVKYIMDISELISLALGLSALKKACNNWSTGLSKSPMVRALVHIYMELFTLFTLFTLSIHPSIHRPPPRRHGASQVPRHQGITWNVGSPSPGQLEKAMARSVGLVHSIKICSSWWFLRTTWWINSLGIPTPLQACVL